MAPHSSTLAWRIPQTEEPGGLQSMGSLGVGHDWMTSLSLFISCIGEGDGNPLPCSCLENPRDEGAWWVAVSGVAQSRTQLKRLSSSSSISTPYMFYLHFHLHPANLENSAVARGLEKVSFHSNPQKGNDKECSNYHTIALISHISKVMLKILQPRLQQ